MSKRLQLALLAAFLVLLVPVMAVAQQSTAEGIPVVSEQHDGLTIVPGDVVSVHVLGVPDLDQAHLRVTDQGEIPLMLIGSVRIAGLTPARAAEKVSAIYKAQHLLRATDVEINVEQYASAEATVLGYVIGQSITSQTNGTAIPLTAPKPLLTILSMAGGFSDRASRTVTIQRRDRHIAPFSLYLPNDPMQSLANDPLIYPGDIVMVPRAGVVYILGNVGHPSGVYMNEDGRLSLMQALSQAGSTLPTAALRNVMVFRRDGSQYSQLHLNVGKIAKGKDPDIALAPQDVIWVPFSYGKNLLVNGATIVAAVSSATAAAIVYTH